MSAVIWCGIVAVWVFVLIPTWVRRGDLHWNRGTAGTVGKVAVAEGLAEKSSAKPGRGERATGRRLLRRSRDVLSIEVEAMAEQDVQSPAESPSYAAPAPRARVAAAPSSGRLGSSVRATFGTGPSDSGRKKPPLRVRRARRLVVLAALALGTLIAAIVSGGMLIVVNILFDIALFLYVRHLRNAARSQAQRVAREKRARVARQAWEEASAGERSSGLDGWSTTAEPGGLPATEAYGATDVVYDDLEYGDEYTDEVEYVDDEVAYAEADADPAEVDLNGIEQPALIDLTDAPTEELAAQAS
jgi:hypothetical protein